MSVRNQYCRYSRLSLKIMFKIFLQPYQKGSLLLRPLYSTVLTMAPEEMALVSRLDRFTPCKETISKFEQEAIQAPEYIRTLQRRCNNLLVHRIKFLGRPARHGLSYGKNLWNDNRFRYSFYIAMKFIMSLCYFHVKFINTLICYSYIDNSLNQDSLLYKSQKCNLGVF